MQTLRLFEIFHGIFNKNGHRLGWLRPMAPAPVIVQVKLPRSTDTRMTMSSLLCHVIFRLVHATYMHSYFRIILILLNSLIFFYAACHFYMQQQGLHMVSHILCKNQQ